MIDEILYVLLFVVFCFSILSTLTSFFRAFFKNVIFLKQLRTENTKLYNLLLVKERENGFNLFNGALNPFKGFVFLFKGSSSLGKKLDVQRIKIKNLIIISLYSLLVLFVCMIIYGIWIYLGIPAKFV